LRYKSRTLQPSRRDTEEGAGALITFGSAKRILPVSLVAGAWARLLGVSRLGVFALVLCAAAALVGPAGAAPPTAAPNCLGKPVVKPGEILLACADAGLGVRKITWLGWGSSIAAGVGTAFANDCTPDCAAGHFHDYRAVLLLSGSQRCAGRVVYRTATVAIVGRPPEAWATVADATYPLRCGA
jgi:hypothetical protein